MLASNEHIVSRAPLAWRIQAIPNDVATKGLKWLFELRQRWDLSMDNVAELLGGLSTSTVKDWKRKVEQGAELSLPRDVVERLSLLLGMHKALMLLTPVDQQDLAWQWFCMPTDLYDLQGRSIRDYLLSAGTMESFYHVRRHLDGAIG